MESAGRDVNLAWEVMGIDGVFRTGSILPECSCCLFSYPQFEIAPLKCSGVRNTLYKIRLQSAHTSPFKHPSTYRLRIPSIYQQYTKVTHTAYPRTVDHRSSSQPDPRHLPEKNENRNAVVRETNLADPRVFEEISLDHDRLDRRIVCAGQIVHTYTVQSTPYGVLFYYVY